MAIFSLHHSVIGKATQARPHTAAAHVRYITRDGVCTRTAGRRLPDRPAVLMRWFCNQEEQDRKNARVCDKLMLALPRELTVDQRTALVQAYAEQITHGRASWFAAFHDAGKDRENPHCHLMIRDRDHETGRRVMLTTERGSTDRLRETWETCCNRSLEQARQAVRISRLSLVAQGLRRAPTIHEGVRARQVGRRKDPVRSRPINVRNAVTARTHARRVDYPTLDAGRSRMVYNAAIRAANEREYWAAIDADAARRVGPLTTPSQVVSSALANDEPAPHLPTPAHEQPSQQSAERAASWLEQRRSARAEQTRIEQPSGVGTSARDLWLVRRRAERERAVRDRDDDGT